MRLPEINKKDINNFVNKSEEPKKAKPNKRTENRSIFFTKDELSKLKEASEKQGLPLATFIRASALKIASEI